MGAAAAGEDELSAAVAGKEERILVSVRVRPLNAKEIEKGDSSDWDCVNTTTIVFNKAPPQGERTLFPTSYKFDRVFGKDVATKQVYEEGAKEVALSVVRGINSSIFAYGQTSSGKTYTMTGITAYSVSDIYQYIKKQADREFTLKFSAMEIYNEAVRDLLSADPTPLRLLDDPEKGTIVEKLIEETLRDQDHLRELLSVCEAQRQIGETSLNEMSSRSHQILRLTIESSNKVFSGRDSSGTLVACVNFVDLAGSERASQAMSAGMRLKEGCHINRSLLTLGTVIRKLSKGGKNGHVPYRDSKLTRILQPALGGNARTAIICTLSPAHTHVEQSRNTLLFACCAKEVVTNARVNLVMSDKALIRHLQRELSKLETELKYTGSGLASCTSHAETLKEKDARIRKLENDLRELMLERDHAQSRLDDLLRSAKNEPSSRQWDELSRTSGTNALSPLSEVFSNSDMFGPLQDLGYRFTLSETQNNADGDLEGHHRRQPSSPGTYNSGFHQSPDRGFEPLTELYEEHCKEVQCVEIDNLVNRTQSDNLSILLPEDTDNLLPLTDADKLEHNEVSSSDDSELPVKVDEELKSVSTTKVVDIFAEPEPRLVSSIVSDLHDGVDHKNLDFSKRVDDDFAEPDLRVGVVHSESCTDLQNKADQRILSFAKRGNQRCVDLELPCEVDQEAEESVVKKVDSFSIPESNVKVSKDQELPANIDHEKNNVTDKAMARFAKVSADVTPLLTSSSGGLTRSRSCHASPMVASAYLIDDLQNQDKMTPPDTFYKDFEVRPERVRRSLYTQNSENLQDRLSIVKSHSSDRRLAVVDVEGEKQVAQGQPEKQIDQTRRAMSEDMSEMNSVKKGSSGFDPTALGPIAGSPSRWPLEFEKKQQEIIELWHVCNVSIVHRTHFFLLFNGDPADAIYMEVELRRLSFLKNNFSAGGNNFGTSSVKTLKREREMLYRQMLKKLNTQERENVYRKWDIVLSSKQRRWQLARLIWTKTDMDHVRESASLVADLIGLSEPGQTLKQMVELSFSVTPPRISRLSFSFRGGSYD